MLLKQSTTRNRSVFMTQSADHVTGLTGATLTINASKDGAAFAAITPTVTELANGWYSLALTTTHTNTLGDIAFHVTAASADPADWADQVVVLLPGEAVALQSDQAVNVTKVAGTTQTARDLGAQLDAAISTRLATAGYTAPDNSTITAIAAYVDTEVAAIKAKTDLIGDAMTLTAGERNAIADALLARNIAGGSSAGRIVTDALRALRNKQAIAGTTLNIYQEDDTTVAWSATVARTAGDPVSSVDPS